jgi:hypothetical protein
MHANWISVRDLYASLLSPLRPTKLRAAAARYSEKMLAAVDQIRSSHRLSEIKPGTSLLNLWLLPSSTSRKIFVDWDENRYVISLGIVTEEQASGFPDGKVYADLEELVPVLERFVTYVESSSA